MWTSTSISWCPKRASKYLNQELQRCLNRDYHKLQLHYRTGKGKRLPKQNNIRHR
jgi:hypothetical protein